jgi:hypothetical protein
MATSDCPATLRELSAAVPARSSRNVATDSRLIRPTRIMLDSTVRLAT